MSTLNAPQVTVTEDAYRALLQAAMVGTQMGETSWAIDIAEALAELRPDLAHAQIVVAMSDYCAGRKDDAIHRLGNLAQAFPDDQLSKAMLAMCMQNTGRPGWQALLESVIDDGRDEHAVGMACALLGRANEAPNASVPVIQETTLAHAMWV